MEASTEPATKNQKRKAKREERYAMMATCSVCKQLMTNKLHKLHKVKEDLYVHKQCYQIIKRRVEKIRAASKREEVKE